MKIISFHASGPIEITPIEDRWYSLAKPVTIFVQTDGEGYIVYKFRKGFLFDGRSGGPLVDFWLPNLGNQRQLACWLVHDANGYATHLSFEDTNELLRQMLRLAGVCRVKASAAKLAVSLTESWFGFPEKKDREYANIQGMAFRVTEVAYPEDMAEQVYAG